MNNPEKTNDSNPEMKAFFTADEEQAQVSFIENEFGSDVDLGEIMEPADESVTVSNSSDLMEAYINFVEPKNGGNFITSAMVLKELSENGITFGINNAEIDRVLTEKNRYSKRYTVAQGKKAVNGNNGTIEFFFNRGNKTMKPKLNIDGSVDYRSLNLIDVVDKGTALARVTPPTKGKNGANIFGKEILAIQGKPAPRLPKGKNTAVSQDGLVLFADAAGQVLLINNVIAVSEVLEIAGNVDNSTGNVDFNGSIVINGNVFPGFRVTAKGNIEVKGSIEGAEVSCSGNLVVGKGILGMYKAKITVGGNTFSKMIQDATIETHGNILSEGIMHCTIQCGGRMELQGKKGLLVGGSISCKKEIEANIVGSPMGTQTDIKVGLETGVFEKYKELVLEFKRLKKQYDKTTKDLIVMGKSGTVGEMPEFKKKSYIKTLYDAKHIQESLSQKQKEILLLKDELNKYKYSGKLTVNLMVHPGVSVQIGNAVLSIRDKLPKCRFVNEDGRVKISYNF